VIAPFRAAAVQFEPRQFAKAANVASFAALVEQAAGEGAKLITTPEMGTTGYCWFDRDEVVGQVEAIPGATTEAFAEIAARRDCYIVIGMPEVERAVAEVRGLHTAEVRPSGSFTDQRRHLRSPRTPEQLATNIGMRSAINKALLSNPNDAVAIKRLLQGEEGGNSQNIGTAFGPDTRMALQQVVDRENAFAGTNNAIVTNAETARRQAAAAMKPEASTGGVLIGTPTFRVCMPFVLDSSIEQRSADLDRR